MSKFLFVFNLIVLCLLLSTRHTLVSAAPKPQNAAVEAEDLETGAAAAIEKDDLEGSSSYGFGYYSSPYLYGGHYGGHYGGYGGYGIGYPYGIGGYYGLGYPYYGGYYGYHGLHGHYF
ncbi:protein suex-1 [Musca domestica]|uniref:Protein suex-1 n=1 Tax=Musca domestica TaxID=7370 RepID=A0A1I8N4B6_MUSDO|nr:protein suex-1 [Musca domestica]XP_058983441.1 protein suex-1 [Musca domestica]